MKRILIIFIFLLTIDAQAMIKIPQGLNTVDRQEVLRILGMSASTKLLSNPYPLGGFSGLEIGYAFENIPIEDISTLGNKTEAQSDFTYPKITIGKGLYYNIDVFIHFIPFSETRGISDYGGMIKWSFYESTYLPSTLSIMVHRNSSNFLNQLSAQTSGVELVAGINVENFALYFGGGQIETNGTFIGGSGEDGITDSHNTEFEDIFATHTFIGITHQFSNLFVALQIDRYTQQPMYSLKLGTRF